MAIEIFGVIAGFSGGLPLLLDPSGQLLGLPSDLLSVLPFSDFLPVGLWLFVVYGVGFSLVTYGLWRRKRWAWSLGILLGVVWICWLFLEFYLYGLQPFIAVWMIQPIIALPLLLHKDTKRSYFKDQVRMTLHKT